MGDDRIIWMCSICDKPIEDGEGYVVVNEGDATRAEEEKRSWDTEHDRAMTFDEMSERPEQVAWRVLHAACDSEPDEQEVYQLDVERIRTAWDALSWTSHLIGKPWLSATNWSSLIRRISAEHGAEII